MTRDADILIDRLKLAISDMTYASMIECELRNVGNNGVLEDAVRGACIITYARPFTTSIAERDGTPKKWLAYLDAEIEQYLVGIDSRCWDVHKAILAERNQLVGHPDWKHHKVEPTHTCHSSCFKTFTHAEFNQVNLLMESFLKQKLEESTQP